MSVTSDTSGTSETASRSCAARRRNWSSPYRWDDSVSARIGTLSMDRGLTSGPVTPGGIRSALAAIFWLSRTMASSSDSPTLKRTITMDCPGLEVE